MLFQISVGPNDDDTDSDNESSSIESDDEEGPNDVNTEETCPPIHSTVHDDFLFEGDDTENVRSCPVRPRRVLDFADDEQ